MRIAFLYCFKFFGKLFDSFQDDVDKFYIETGCKKCVKALFNFLIFIKVLTTAENSSNRFFECLPNEGLT